VSTLVFTFWRELITWSFDLTKLNLLALFSRLIFANSSSRKGKGFRLNWLVATQLVANHAVI